MKKLISTKDALYPEQEGKFKGGSPWLLVATFLVPAVIVVALLFVLISFRGGIEAGVANLALLLPVGYAFAAGMVASVNPCGVLLLSSYAFYQVRSEGKGAPNRPYRAVVVSLVVTLGFMVIFALTGSVIAAGGRWLLDVFPIAGLIIGAVMAVLGVWLLATRKTIGILGGKPTKIDPQRSLGNAFLFGVAYAVGSLSCTLPIFLAVVGSALAGEGLSHSFGQFAAYALGMGSVIFVVTVGAALFRRAMAKWLRALTPHMHRLSTMFMIGAGLYLIYYYLTT
jgi:cytochrome c biogenesis protein CcdA